MFYRLLLWAFGRCARGMLDARRAEIVREAQPDIDRFLASDQRTRDPLG